ncbi:MAG: M28 family peptidase [Planctomycetota bacterium]
MKRERGAAVHALFLIVALAAAFVVHRPRVGSGDFDVERAHRDLEHIARAPHPVGSEEHARVAAYLEARLATLAEAFPEVDGRRAEVRVQTGRFGGQNLRNLQLFVPGHSRGALLLAAHYDSVPTAPGAGDDGAACAAWLETLRVLSADGPPARDLLLLLTDGEELGLFGARLFAQERLLEPATALPIAAVLNFEAIGNDGPSCLFQTGPLDGALVRAYGRGAPHPVGTSLAPWIYEQLPNDTDLSVFRELGIPGLNFAILGGGSAYHRPHDSPANLSDATLAHQGRTMLGVTRAILALGDAPLAAPSRGFQDVLGIGFVTFPPALGPALALLAILAAGALLVRAGGVLALVTGPLQGAMGFLVAGAAAALAVWLGGLVGVPLGRFLGLEPVPRGNYASVACWFAASLVAAAGGWRVASDAAWARRRASGGLLLLALASAALAWFAPEGAHSLAAPTLLATCAVFALERESKSLWPEWIAAALVALALTFSSSVWHLLVQVLGTDPGTARNASVLFAAGLAGWMAPSLRRLPAGPTALVGLSSGVVLALVATLLDASGG